MKRAAIAYRALSFLLVAFLSTACDKSDPFSAVDGDPNAPDADLTAPDADLTAPDAPPVPDADPNAADAAPTACAPVPARMVVVGDSIMWCWGVSDYLGPLSDKCGVKIFNGYMNQHYAAGITYENLSVPGAVTSNIPGQLGTSPRAGHVLMMIYIGGNDLVDFLGMTDAESMTFFASRMPAIRNTWETQIFPFFENSNNFPDGVTVVMNTQYNPYDDCNTEGNIKMTAVKIGLLAEYNRQLTEMANARDYVFITDQHGPFLGHGQANTRTNPACPHYIPNAEYWMFDEIHPNDPGYASLAAEWAKTADLIYRDCI